MALAIGCLSAFHEKDSKEKFIDTKTHKEPLFPKKQLYRY